MCKAQVNSEEQQKPAYFVLQFSSLVSRQVFPDESSRKCIEGNRRQFLRFVVLSVVRVLLSISFGPQGTSHKHNITGIRCQAVGKKLHKSTIHSSAFKLLLQLLTAPANVETIVQCEYRSVFTQQNENLTTEEGRKHLLGTQKNATHQQ